MPQAMPNSIDFGFLPEAYSYSGGGLIIEPREDIKELTKSLRESDRVHNHWVYPPLHELHKRHATDSDLVLTHAPIYVLPETHILRHQAGSLPDQKLCELAITVLGFLRGVRLVPEGWSHFYRAATRIGQLVDFGCGPQQVSSVLETTVNFWNKYSGREIPAKLFAAFHWYLFSQSYEHEFELFNAQYIVLDTCWWLFCSLNGLTLSHVKHAERPIEMCRHFGMPIPVWTVISNKQSYLSELRNEFSHGGYFAGAPIGFEFPDKYDNIVLELQNLNCRLLLALLTVKSPYIVSPVDTLQTMYLEII